MIPERLSQLNNTEVTERDPEISRFFLNLRLTNASISDILIIVKC
jgi:hypothetical protein